MSIDQYQFVVSELANHKGAWPEIAKECEVSYSWICKIAKNKIPNASHRRVERLAASLRSRRRSVSKPTP